LESGAWEKHKFLSGFRPQKGCDLCSRCQMLVSYIKKQNRSVNEMKELVLENNRIAVLEVTDMLGILFGLVQSTVKDFLNMWQIAIKFVPHDCTVCYLCMSFWLKTKLLYYYFTSPTHAH
jgi:hypothetical protein